MTTHDIHSSLKHVGRQDIQAVKNMPAGRHTYAQINKHTKSDKSGGQNTQNRQQAPTSRAAKRLSGRLPHRLAGQAGRHIGHIGGLGTHSSQTGQVTQADSLTHLRGCEYTVISNYVYK